MEARLLRRPSWRAVLAWLFLLLLSLELALDRVALGRLRLLLPLLILCTAGVVLAVPPLTGRLVYWAGRLVDRWSLGLRYASLGVLLLLALATYLIWSLRSSQADSRLERRAREHFRVVADGAVPQERVRALLVDLERQAAVLRERWQGLADGGPVVTVRLFKDGRALREQTGIPAWAGARTLCHVAGATIYLAADSGPGPFDFISSATTPGHEAVHAVTCHLWGPEASRQVPPWFHEGLAEYETLQGTRFTFERAFVRLFLWFDRGRLPPASDFCSPLPRAIATDPGLFYAASFQFMRYLVDTYGEAVVTRLPQEVAQDRPFDEALMVVTGARCEDLYSRWLSNL